MSIGKLGRRALVLAALALGLPLACGGPRYPSCDNDEQCNDDVHKGVCVSHVCVECRGDDTCGKGKECRDGACSVIEGWCDRSHACAAGDCGDDHKCHTEKIAAPSVECDEERPCMGKSHCENGHCVAPSAGGPGCTDFPAPKFDFDTPDLRGDSRQVIQRLAACLSSGSLKGSHVLLTGHCDARGESEYNLTLGAQRAENVKTLLVGLGVPMDRIKTSSRGKLDAIASDDAGMVNDRRVDIEVR